MLIIEEFQAEMHGYDSLIRVHNASWTSNPVAVGALRHSDETRNPTDIYKRLIAIVDGTVRGYGGYTVSEWEPGTGKYLLFGCVHPNSRRRGIGTALYNALLDNLSIHRPRKVECDTHDDQPDGVSFLENRGFECVLREQISRLQVSSVDTSKYEGVLDKLTSQGIDIYTLAERKQSDSDWLVKIYNFLRGENDLSSTEEVEQQAELQRFEQRYFEGPNRLDRAQIVAVDEWALGQPYVGFSGVSISPTDKSRLVTIQTSVHPSYRRRGIATGMKVRVVKFAQQYGAKIIETENETTNPMYQINLKLGFKPVSAQMIYQKRLSVD